MNIGKWQNPCCPTRRRSNTSECLFAAGVDSVGTCTGCCPVMCRVVMNARSKAADEVSKLGERRDALAGKSASPKATKGDAVKKQRK
jgi:hypothetical protein